MGGSFGGAAIPFTPQSGGACPADLVGWCPRIRPSCCSSQAPQTQTHSEDKALLVVGVIHLRVFCLAGLVGGLTTSWTWVSKVVSWCLRAQHFESSDYGFLLYGSE